MKHETRPNLMIGPKSHDDSLLNDARERIHDADGLSERIHTLRSHFYAKSDEAAAQGRFQDALDAVATVARHEPERRPEAEARAASIRERWSERLAAGSQDHEAQGRLGPALALRLRAIEVADRDLDRRAAARLGEVLASRGRLSCSLAIEGAPERVQHLEQALRAELAAIPGIDLVRQGLIHARIDAPPPVCTESYTVSPAAHPYVAGQRELPNPAYGALLDELEAARGRAIEAARAEAGARERVRTLGESRRGMRAALIPDEVSLEAALSEGRALLEQIEEAKEQIGRSLERIESLRATGGDGLQAAVIDLRATQQRLDEDRERLIRVQATAKTLEDVVEARRGQLKEASAELEQGSTALQRLAGDREVARAQVAVLEERLLHTPASLWEDVVETLWYERSRHTRTCEGRVVVAVAEAPPRQLVQRRQVHDEAHPAWPEQGLPEDPLLFPASDEVLIAEIDAQLATELAALIRGALRERIERRMDEATAMTEARPGDGLEIWLASALATPTLLDPGARAQLLRHLREAYGLEAPERFLP